MELNPYKHAEWNAEQGLASGRIQAIAQTPDGYLWIGTADGLLRFDGLHFVPVLTELNQPLPQVLGLTVDQDGILWVRGADTRIRQMHRDGIGPPLSFQDHLLSIVAMGTAQGGGIFATDNHKTVFRLVRDHVDGLPIHSNSLLISISEATDNRLWIGTDRGLLSWMEGLPTSEAGPAVDQKINCLLAATEGHLWVGTDDGLAYWDGQQLVRRTLPGPEMQHLQILALMMDRDGNLWLGTSKGLLKYNAAGVEWVSTGPHGDRPPVTTIMQDREGDVWFGVGSTLERVQSTSIVPVRRSDSASSNRFGPIYVDPHGRLWFADIQHGLYWMDHGIARSVTNDGLADDEVYSIDGSGDDVWVARRAGGVTRLRLADGRLESRTWTTRDGLSQNSAYVLRVGAAGVVWVGTLTAGLDRFEDGRFTHFDETDGLPANDVSAIELNNHGDVWIGTSRGVCKVNGSRCVPVLSDQHTPVSDVLSLLYDPSHGLWVGTAKGLLLANQTGQRKVALEGASAKKIEGLGLDRSGRLWILSDGVVRSVVPSDLLASQNRTSRTYGSDDGLEPSENVHRSRSVVTDAEGRVWISTAHELAMINSRPAFLPSVIPHVEEVSADGALLDLDRTQVPPEARRLTFSFTGLDLHAPSRVLFRYRLDNFDKTWSDVTSDRQATYTNLPPGSYRFRLIASNESNSWNSKESVVAIVVEPGLWQRWTTRLGLATAFILLFVFAYHTRTRFLLAQANILADERLRERVRIARDIHDTLLQGFISSLMHLHLAERQISSESPLKQKFSFVLEGMERVIEEARLAVVGLRTPDSGHGGLESGLQDFFQEIADLGDAHLTLRSDGRPRRLKVEAGDHISSIAKEAILNAMRHANARNVRVTIVWGWLRFRLSIADDGRGMDATTLQHGRARHWGLVGMRERAKQLRASLAIESRPGGGTNVRLQVAAANAYQKLTTPGNAD